MQSFVEIVPLVPGKKMFEGFFTIYEHGGHLSHMTSIMLLNLIYMFLKPYIQNLIKNDLVASEKTSFNFHM